MPTRDLGSMGESVIEKWAHERGIIPNRPQKDKKGWDMLLEFPKIEFPNKKTYPLDIRPPEVSCMVQIKSTDKSEGKIKGIKLSNWERMANSPVPCFFIILEFDKKNDPQRAYLVHFDDFWIGKTLKRLRELETKDINSLHKKTVQLNYSSADELDCPGAEALENGIRKHVGDDPRKYFQKKCEWISNVGFEEYRSRVHFTLKEMPYDMAMDTLVDFAIGEVREIDIASLEIEEIRFGIPKQIDSRATQPKLRIGAIPPSGKADLAIIKTDDESIVFKEQFEYFSPTSLFPFIPFDYCKIKFISDLFAIIISLKDKKVNINANLFDQESGTGRLSKLHKAVKFMRQCASSPHSKFKMELERGDNNFDIGSFHSIDFPKFEPQIENMLSLIEDVWFISNQFDISGEIDIGLFELMKQEGRIAFMKVFLKNEKVAYSSGTLENDIVPDLSDVAFLFCSYVLFGNNAMVVSGAIQGDAHISQDGEDKLLVISNGRARCVKKWLTSKRTLYRKSFFKKAFKKSSDLLTNEGVKTLLTFEKVSFNM